MSDPRILPDTTLDTYRADVKRANDNDLGHVWLWRAQELLAHIDAAAGGRAEAKAEALPLTHDERVSTATTRPFCLRCEVPIYQDASGIWRREATAVADCPRNPAGDGHEPAESPQDPRIIPDEVLAEYEAALENGLPWDAGIVRALLEHGKALAEQVERAEGLAAARLRDLDDEREAHDHTRTRYREMGARAEKAEAEAGDLRLRLDSAIYDAKVDALNLERATLARDDALILRDAAEQRLADRDKAIRDLADRAEPYYWVNEYGDEVASHHKYVKADDLRALLPEETTS